MAMFSDYWTAFSLVVAVCQGVPMAPCHFLYSALFALFWIGGGSQYTGCNETASTTADGSCDPWNNNIECGYDGGDCCECTCSQDRLYPCGFDGFDCLDPSASNVTSECQDKTSNYRLCSAEYTVQDWVVNDTRSARAFAEAVNCTGGTFNVTWKGRVVIDRTIYVAEGTTVNLSGADSESEVDGGGSIRIFTLVDASLHVFGMVLSNGNATYGGAIAAAGSKITLNDTTFNNNFASSVAGAVYMENSIFIAWGGQATFARNSAGLQGGALVAARGSNISWYGPTWFFNNTALYYGGSVSIHNSIVSWSGETSFVNNSGGSGGSLFIGDNSSVSWSAETSFINNNAAAGSGGALYVDDGCRVWWNGASSFIGNAANWSGGALFIDENSDVSWSAETSYMNNSGYSGGAIYVRAGSRASWTGETSFLNNNAAPGYGGGLYIYENSSVSWSAGTSYINNSGDFGGAIYVRASSIASWSSETSFLNNNAAAGEGGALRAYDGCNVWWGGNTSFNGNVASSNGGALSIYINSNIFGSAETSFLNNSGDFGGAIYVRAGSRVSWAAETSFLNNTAGNYGGALFVYEYSSVSWSAETSFLNNTAGSYGGALFLHEYSSVYWFAETSFEGNGGDFGGAIYIEGGSNVSWTAATSFNINNAVAGSGGALYIDDGCNVWWGGNTSFSNNAANRSGGALLIHNSSSVSWSAETSFEGNGGDFGGAIYIEGGSNVSWTATTSFNINNAVAGSGGSLYIDDGCNVWWGGNTSFSNTAANRSGGALFIHNSSSVSWYAETSFLNNTAGNYGGALFVYKYSSVSWFAVTSFVGNGGDFGGAIYIEGGSNVSWTATTSFNINNAVAGSGGALYIDDGCNVWWGGNTSFSNNAANQSGGALLIHNSSSVSWSAETSFEGNGGDFGGAIYIEGGSNVSWTATTSFNINNAVAGSGGSLYIDDGCNVWWGGNTSFSNTAANRSGGALFIHNSSSVSWYAETSFLNNTAGNYGGALFVYKYSSVSWFAVTSFVGNGGDFGGAIYIEGGSNVSWTATTSFNINNAVAGSGGALYIDDGCNVWWGGNTSFSNTAANRSGGALFIHNSSSVSWYAETSFLNNTAGNYGGALFVHEYSSVSWFAVTSFEGNGGDFGGAIYIEGGSNVSWTAATSININNAVAGSGGALYIDDGCNVWWGGNTSFSNNAANWSGGALFIYDDSSVSWTEKSAFNNNIAGNYGGAVVVANGSSTSWEAPTTFFNNTALSYWGGAILVYENSGLFWEAMASFMSNTAGVLGGGLASMFGSTVTMAGETFFQDNVAGTDGGAAYIYHSDDQVQTLVTIHNTTVFRRNRCEANGGGMALIGSVSTELETANMSFYGNIAGVAGGAVYVSGAVFGPKFVGTRFISNSADIGGGVYTTGSGIAVVPNILGVPEPQDPFTFISCKFLENKAATRGGALDSGAGIDRIVNTLFVGNTAGSGGASRLAGESSLEGCDFVENSSDEDKGPAIYNEGLISNMSNCRFVGNVFNCESKHFFAFDELNVSLDTVCKDCDVECENCAFGGKKPMCVEEIDHSISPGGNTTVELLKIEHGYWRVSNTSTNILDCYNEDACKGGVTGAPEYCLEGYEGPYCSVCSDGYTPSLGSSCNKCSDTNGLGIALIVVFSVVTFVVCIAILNYMLSGQEQSADRGIVARISRFIPLQSLKIVVVVWQILTQFCTVANFSFPGIYQGFLDGVDLLNFDFSWVISTGCILDIDFHDRLLISTLGPIVGMAILGATYTVAINRHRGSEAVCHIVRRKHLSMVLLLTFLVYSSVSTTVFTMFVCDDLDDGTTYLRVDYRINCDSSIHRALQIYAGFMAVLYAVGIPAFYASLLFRNRDTLTKDENRENNGDVTSFADLWKPYKPRYFFYEVVECCRRVLLTGVVVFIYQDSAAQIAVALIMATTFFIFSEALAPYESAWDSLVGRMGHAIVVTSMFLALLLKVDVSEEGAKSQKVFEAVLITVHVAMILVVIVEAGAMIVAWKKEVVSEDPAPRFGRTVGVETFTEETPYYDR